MKHRITTQALRRSFAILLAMVTIASCGGSDEYEPPADYVAPDAPCEGCSDSASSTCSGTPVAGCEGIDVEFCTVIGCELRYLEDEESASCAGETPTCEAMTSRDLCVAIDGCIWAE